MTAYEGGISAPFIAYWPAGIPEKQQNTIVRQPAHLIDVMPTLLDVAGVTYGPKEGEPKLEGQSLVPMLHGEPIAASRDLFWEHEGNRAARVGKWKIVALASQPWELYDMETDRIESHDLAGEMPDKVKELEAAYNEWAARCHVVPWDKIEPHRPKK